MHIGIKIPISSYAKECTYKNSIPLSIVCANVQKEYKFMALLQNCRHFLSLLL